LACRRRSQMPDKRRATSRAALPPPSRTPESALPVQPAAGQACRSGRSPLKPCRSRPCRSSPAALGRAAQALPLKAVPLKPCRSRPCRSSRAAQGLPPRPGAQARAETPRDSPRLRVARDHVTPVSGHGLPVEAVAWQARCRSTAPPPAERRMPGKRPAGSAGRRAGPLPSRASRRPLKPDANQRPAEPPPTRSDPPPSAHPHCRSNGGPPGRRANRARHAAAGRAGGRQATADRAALSR
jgi:hypothetical protein